VQRGPIFLSYRRSDSAGHAGRIYDRLAARFPGRVFRDFEALSPGVDFAREIDLRVSTASAMVAVIGPAWAARRPDGGARLHDEDDFVRLELAAAIKRNIPLIPVLVQGADLPNKDELPEELRPLVRRQALTVREDSFDAGMQKLIAALQKALQIPASASPNALGERQPPGPPPAGGGGGGFLIGAGLTSAAFLALCCGLVGLGLYGQQLEVQQAQQVPAVVDPGTAAVASVPTAPAPVPAPPAGTGAATFAPTGAWRLQNTGGVALGDLYLNPDASFRVDVQMENGFAAPASIGTWSFDAASRTVTLAGIDSQGLPFLNPLIVTEYHGEPSAHWHVTSPQYGALELWPGR
jgi:TIR domain